MPFNTIYLVTGANRGIGNGLIASFLARPNTTAIAVVRSESTDTSLLTNLPTGEGSKLIIGYFAASFSSPADTEASAKQLHDTLVSKHGITYINTIVACAGMGTSFNPSLSTPLSAMTEHFNQNTLAPLALFQALFPLLSVAEKGKKFMFITSSLGSIGDMEREAPTLAYGVSKAGANYFVRKVHFECPEITTLAIHPGWVKTDMGQFFAHAIGAPEAPMTLDESVSGCLERIDSATRDVNSGTFVNYDGKLIKW
ncbi:putative aflatoxin biosynthesis ketoreductase nor-1 [Halenospora varia]|nr:putative aflatoxin biosynthesis ketoreductase nor-1 [Halenospora varia]